MKSRRSGRGVIKILIAEDSPTQADQLKYLLEEHNYEVAVAANGKDALAVAPTYRPDIVISDIVMPEMDGYTLCRRINSRRDLGDIPVILLTSLSTPQDVLKGLQCGASSFIRKPYDEQYLLSRIEYVITNRALRKSDKAQMVLEIYLGGQKHKINSEKQQILDMLIATSEEAVLLNEDLKGRERQLTRSYQSLNALFHISEGLNQCTTEREVAEKSLERTAELPDVYSGWFAIREGETGFRVAAARNLPPSLSKPGALDGDCLCRQKLLSGEFSRATNILECERLKNSGRTNGLRYHASVPVWIGNQILGIMNLAGREQGMLSEDDLRVLHGVGNQVGVALERARLYEHLEKMVEEKTAALKAEIGVRKKAEEKAQANLERIRALHEIDLATSSSLDLRTVLAILLEKMDVFFPYETATVIRLLEKGAGKLTYVASRNIDLISLTRQKGQSAESRSKKIIEARVPFAVPNLQTDPRQRNRDFYVQNGLVSYLGVPLVTKDDVVGILALYTKQEHDFTNEEIDFLVTLAGQAAIAIHNAQLYEQLVRSNRVKDDFLSIMSHELRTPLNVVMGYTAMIKDGLLGEVNPQQAEALQKVTDQANDQLAMINNVLYATVLEVQKPVLDAQEMSPAEFLDQLRSDYDARLQPEGLSLQWNYARDLPVIRTDSAKLRVVLQNLINNAIKFTGKGVVTVSARIRQRAVGNRQQEEETLTPTWVEFKVSDTGVGISKEQLPFIFEKFHQADTSQTRSFGGVGMGLYIVKRFTELLGGTVEVESEPGKGSTFTVRIPA